MAGDKGFGGMAKKWLKAQTDELLAGDREERARANNEAERIEREAKEKATEEAVISAVPGLRDFTDRMEAQKRQDAANREAKRAAELASRPLAGVGLAVTGDLVGSWAGQLPALVGLDDAGHLWVDLTPLDGQNPMVSGLAFRRWHFVIPRWTGAGTYDLVAILRQLEEEASQATGEDDDVWLPDSTEWSFDLDETVYDTFYWHPDAGASTIEAGGEDGRQLKLHLAMDSSGGSIVVVAEVNLPPIEPR